MKLPDAIPVSRQIEARFNHRRVLRMGVAGVYVIGTLIYLFWRLSIFNADSPGVSVAFYAAEWIGFVLGLTVIFSAWRYTHREPLPARQDQRVDVLVPTYREPLHVIRRTLMAARDIHYPHQTWLLDDAKRPEVEALAQTLGVRYLARGHNLHAKAGNLNFGLQHSQADFVAVFDADHIAQPHALDALLGLMTDERVAMVQTPQDYYNTDAFQYLNPRKQAGLWHDQSYFYNLAQSCRDTWNAASCVGTGVLYRRTALDVIGGIPVDTVTEDFHTSLKLHRQGWETRYLNEPVAYGIAAADLGEYYKTRHRWAHGNLATLWHERILTCSGLSLKQRLSYLSLGLIYLEGWQQLLLFLIPILALVWGWAPFEISLFNVLMVLGFPIVGYVLLQEFGCGFSRFWTNELFAMARWPVHLASAAALFGKKLSWRSSAKNVQGAVSWRLMLPQVAVFIVSGLALSYAAWRLSHDFVVGPLAGAVWNLLRGQPLAEGALFATLPAGYSAELVAIAGFWALFNMVRAGAFMIKALSNARHSHAVFRFEIPLPVTWAAHPDAVAQTIAISETWVRIAVPAGWDVPMHDTRFTLHLPDGPLLCQLDVDAKTDRYIEGHFKWSCPAEQDQLAATLYSIDWQREMQAHHAYFLTPSDVVGRLLGLNPKGGERKRQWRAGLLQRTDSPQCQMPVLAAQISKSPSSFEIISFDPLACGETYPVKFQDGADTRNRLTITRALPIASLPHTGLNGRSYSRYLAILGPDFVSTNTLN